MWNLWRHMVSCPARTGVADQYARREGQVPCYPRLRLSDFHERVRTQRSDAREQEADGEQGGAGRGLRRGRRVSLIAAPGPGLSMNDRPHLPPRPRWSTPPSRGSALQLSQWPLCFTRARGCGRGASDPARRATKQGDTAAVLYSSGSTSTGAGKGVVLTDARQLHRGARHAHLGAECCSAGTPSS